MKTHKINSFQSLNWQKLTVTDQCVRGLRDAYIAKMPHSAIVALVNPVGIVISTEPELNNTPVTLQHHK